MNCRHCKCGIYKVTTWSTYGNSDVYNHYCGNNTNLPHVHDHIAEPDLRVNARTDD